jgi:hypothetical protein
MSNQVFFVKGKAMLIILREPCIEVAKTETRLSYLNQQGFQFRLCEILTKPLEKQILSNPPSFPDFLCWNLSASDQLIDFPIRESRSF